MTNGETREQAEYRGEALAVRSVIGGALMGLANLVPGISGGTMLLAMGIYPQFINAVSEVTRFRFRAKSTLILACIVGAAACAIVGFAGLVGGLVVAHRWAMYSLFVGLTLGGVPVLWSMVRPVDATVIAAAIVALLAMVALAVAAPTGGGGPADHGYALAFLAGLAGASAMVLPGISGGYLLLLMGQYVVVLSAIAALKEGLGAGDWARVGESLHTIVPLGLGVAVGVVGVSNLVRLFLARYERPTLGALLGLLLGAVVGLWPFQEGRPPVIGEAFRGDRVVEEGGVLIMETTGRAIEPHDWATVFFTPSAGRIAGAAALIVVGFLISFGVAHLGGGGKGDRGADPRGGDLANGARAPRTAESGRRSRS